MEFDTIASSFGLEGWLTSINLSASASAATPGCLYFAYLRSIVSKVPSQAELVRFVPQSFQSRSLPFLTQRWAIQSSTLPIHFGARKHEADLMSSAHFPMLEYDKTVQFPQAPLAVLSH